MERITLLVNYLVSLASTSQGKIISIYPGSHMFFTKLNIKLLIFHALSSDIKPLLAINLKTGKLYNLILVVLADMLLPITYDLHSFIYCYCIIWYRFSHSSFWVICWKLQDPNGYGWQSMFWRTWMTVTLNTQLRHVSLTSN